MQFDIKKGYCCEDIREIVQGAADVNDVPLKYLPKFRYFVIMLCSAFEHTNKDVAFARLIAFCPWCGTQFPPSLGDVYYEVLRAEFPHEDCDGTKPCLPKEFESDEWWKKRGL